MVSFPLHLSKSCLNFSILPLSLLQQKISPRENSSYFPPNVFIHLLGFPLIFPLIYRPLDPQLSEFISQQSPTLDQPSIFWDGYLVSFTFSIYDQARHKFARSIFVTLHLVEPTILPSFKNSFWYGLICNKFQYSLEVYEALLRQI